MPSCAAGVKYEDVAGIDRVKGDIQVAMDMLLGAPSFRAMGARPYRVRSLLPKVDIKLASGSNGRGNIRWQYTSSFVAAGKRARLTSVRP